MEMTPEDIIATILSDGPFSRETVESWPDDLRKDYLQLMELDLRDLGRDEFKRQARFIGETYLLSHGQPIHTSTVLLKAWLDLTGGEPPPEMLLFQAD